MSRSTRIFYLPITVFLCLLLLPDQVAAQIDFSGTWAYNQSKSTQPGGGGRGGGGRGRMGTPSDMTITQEGNTIKIESMRRSRQGEERKVTETIIVDGEPHESDTGFGTVTATASWKDSTLVVEETRTMSRGGQSMTVTTTSTYKLSDDGKELTVEMERSGMGGGGPTTRRTVYDKK